MDYCASSSRAESWSSRTSVIKEYDRKEHDVRWWGRVVNAEVSLLASPPRSMGRAAKEVHGARRANNSSIRCLPRSPAVVPCDRPTPTSTTTAPRSIAAERDSQIRVGTPLRLQSLDNGLRDLP